MIPIMGFGERYSLSTLLLGIYAPTKAIPEHGFDHETSKPEVPDDSR